MSEEIALAIIDRVCHTYNPEYHFCEWQAANRNELLQASRPAYQLIDKKLIKNVMKQYEKIANAKPLDDNTRKALIQTSASGLLDTVPGMSITAKQYFGELRYVQE